MPYTKGVTPQSCAARTAIVQRHLWNADGIRETFLPMTQGAPRGRSDRGLARIVRLRRTNNHSPRNRDTAAVCAKKS